MHQQEPSGRTITIGKTVSALCRLSGEIVSRGQTFCREVAEDLAKARRDERKQRVLLAAIPLSLPEKYFVLWAITDGVAKAKGWERYGPPEYRGADTDEGDIPDLDYSLEETIKSIRAYANSPRAVYDGFMEAAATLSYDYLETAEEWVREHALDPVETVPLELRRAIEGLPYLEKIKRVEEILKDVIADLAQALPALGPQIQEIGRPVGAVVAAPAVRRDAGAEQGGKGTNRPPATPEAIAQSVKHFYGLLADHVAAVGDQLELAANPLLKPHLPTARIRAFAVRCALQSVPCDGLAGPHNPLAGILPGPVKPEVVLSWVHSLAGGMTSNIRAACTRLAQLMPAVEAWVNGESPASAELIAGWGGARERLFKGVKEAFEMLPSLVAQAGGLPCPKDVTQTPAPAEPTDLDDLIDILNAPRDWPPPTVAAELTAAGEKQQPGLTESVEEELCRRRMVPLTTLIRQNNENSYTPGDPEELEIAMEKLGYYMPKYLSMEMEYERSHSEGFSEAHRREESLKQHGRALRMHELDPSLPPVPTFTDNPVVDEKNLWKWCTDAEAPAKPQAGTPGADKVAGPGQGAGHTSQEAKAGTDNGGDSTKRRGKRREPLIPTADERKIAEYYEQSGKAQEAVADELNANWKKLGLKGERFPLSQKKMSEIVKKVNARRMFDKQPQIPTVRKGAPKRMEASKLDLGPRKHKGRGLQQRGNMQWDEKGED